MIQQIYSVTEAAKELGVEAHALRYWEEELGLTIERNAQGRRIYTRENIKMFQDIMTWKEQGMQLKNIREMIHGNTNSRRIIVYRPKENLATIPTNTYTEEQERTEKARRLQELLKQFISESIRESNEELLQLLKEGLLKELDYQFRLQEEREEERERNRIEKEDEHFKCLDESLRNAMEKRGKRRKKVLGR